MKIRKVSASEHILIRRLRLATLRDAPDSFAESEYDVSMRPNTFWVNLAQSFNGKHIMFIAELNDIACGSVYGIRDENNPNSGRVGGLWVTSKQRGRGLGTALLSAVLQWAKSEEFSAVRLWTPANNTKTLYSKIGFLPTGQTKSISGDKPFVVREMVLELSQYS